MGARQQLLLLKMPLGRHVSKEIKNKNLKILRPVLLKWIILDLEMLMFKYHFK